MVFRTSHFGIVRKVLICSSLMLIAECVLAASEFTLQRRVGYTSGDQWEPVLAADARAHIYILFPQYGPIAQCPACTAPTMVLLTSDDNGVSWGAPRPLLPSPLGQFDAQIKVDPVDRETLYASWLQGKHDVIVARSQDFGYSWYFSVAEHSTEVVIDKPVLAVRGPDVYVSFNHDQTLGVAASHDYGQNFSSTVVNPRTELGWSLAAGATVDPAGNVYFSWTAYPRINLQMRSGKSLSADQQTEGGAGTRRRLTLPRRPRTARRKLVPLVFWTLKWLWLPMMSEQFTPYGTLAQSEAARSASISRLPRMEAKVGRRRLRSQMPLREWSIVSLLSPRAEPVTCASRGWTLEWWMSKTVRFGIPSTVLPPTVEQPGRRSRTSPGRCGDMITSSPAVSYFLLATCFPSASITLAPHTSFGAKAETTSLQARSGTREDDKLAACQDESSEYCWCSVDMRRYSAAGRRSAAIVPSCGARRRNSKKL